MVQVKVPIKRRASIKLYTPPNIYNNFFGNVSKKGMPRSSAILAGERDFVCKEKIMCKMAAPQMLRKANTASEKCISMSSLQKKKKTESREDERINQSEMLMECEDESEETKVYKAEKESKSKVAESVRSEKKMERKGIEKRKEKTERKEEEKQIDSNLPQGDMKLYMNIITIQTSDGNWVFSEIAKHLPKIKKMPKTFLSDIKEKEDIYCTIYVICYLEKYYQSQYDEWILVEKKAIRWLKQRNITVAEHKESILSVL